MPLLGSWDRKCSLWRIPAAHGSLLWQNVRKLPSLMALDRVCWGFAHSQGNGPLFARLSVVSLGGDLLRSMLTKTPAHLGFFSVQPLQTLLCTGPLCHPNPTELPGTAALGACPRSCLWPHSQSLTALLRAWASPIATYSIEASNMKTIILCVTSLGEM